MEGGQFKRGLQKFFATGGVESAPAEERGVLERLAPTDVGGEGRQADALSERGEILAEHGAGLNLVKKNAGGPSRGQVAADHGDGVLGGPEICGRG